MRALALCERMDTMKSKPTMALHQLVPGQSGSVDALCATGALRRRLLDIGLTQNASVRCLFSAPSGDPSAYLIRDAVIALRREDAATVLLSPCEEGSSWA